MDQSSMATSLTWYEGYRCGMHTATYVARLKPWCLGKALLIVARTKTFMQGNRRGQLLQTVPQISRGTVLNTA